MRNPSNKGHPVISFHFIATTSCVAIPPPNPTFKVYFENGSASSMAVYTNWTDFA